MKLNTINESNMKKEKNNPKNLMHFLREARYCITIHTIEFKTCIVYQKIHEQSEFVIKIVLRGFWQIFEHCDIQNLVHKMCLRVNAKLWFSKKIWHEKDFFPWNVEIDKNCLIYSPKKRKNHFHYCDAGLSM